MKFDLDQTWAIKKKISQHPVSMKERLAVFAAVGLDELIAFGAPVLAPATATPFEIVAVVVHSDLAPAG